MKLSAGVALISALVLLSCKSRPEDTSGILSDGVEFQVQPINTTEVNCSAIILKGTDRFKGSYYIMPRALIAVDKAGNRMFGISKLENGKYLLQIGLFFPSSFENLKTRDNELLLNGCDTVAVQRYIDRQYANEPEYKVRFFGQLPVQGITVHIPGIAAPYQLGKPGDELLNYEGLDNIAEFEMTEQEMRDTVTRISNSVGLEISVGFDFKARRSTGFANVTLNSRDVLTALDASLKGKVYVADVDLRGKLQMLMASKQINVYTEGQLEDANYQEISRKLLEAIVAEDQSLVDQSNVNREKEPVQDAGYGNAIGDATEALSNAAQLVKVDALMQHLRKAKEYKFTFTRMGDNSTIKYRTSALLRGRLSESEVEELELNSGEPATTFPVTISKGDRLIISPQGAERFDLKYGTTKTYFSKEQLAKVRAKLSFAELGWSRELYEYEASDGGMRAYIWDGWTTSVFNYKYYVWGKIEAAVTERVPSAERAARLDYRNAPVAVEFTRLPKRTLAEFAKGSPGNYAVTVDGEGRLVVEALADLGKMKLSNTETFRAAGKAQFGGQQTPYKVEFFQEKLAHFSDTYRQKQIDQGQSVKGVFPAAASTIKLNVISVELEKDKVPLIKLERSVNRDKSAMVL